MWKKFLYISVFFTIFLANGLIFAAEPIRFDFEEGEEEWKIPDWAFYQSDHVATSSEVSTDVASSGTHSLKIECNFPGDEWKAALVDRVKDVDLSEYKTISAEVYLPKNARNTLLQARMIFTAGNGWYFIEMKTAVPLRPGKWIQIKAKMEESAEGESDWKGRGDKKLSKNVNLVRKIAVRIEYDAAPPYKSGSKYQGPVYVDNIVIE